MWRERLAALAFLALPAAAAGQGFRIAPLLQGELRAGFVVSRESAALAGIVVNVPAGYYVRVATSLEGGRALAAPGGGALRAEIAARFLTDPFGQSRWGAYGGGGVVASWRERSRGQGTLLLLAGIEFPGDARWRPALEVAGGAGLRVGVSLKPARTTGR